jgi:hypothetical protein
MTDLSKHNGLGIRCIWGYDRLLVITSVAVEKVGFPEKGRKSGDRRGDWEKSFVELPDAIQFLQIPSERVFQQPRLFTIVRNSCSAGGLEVLTLLQLGVLRFGLLQYRNVRSASFHSVRKSSYLWVQKQLEERH